MNYSSTAGGEVNYSTPIGGEVNYSIPLEALDEKVQNLLPGLRGQVVQVGEDSAHFGPEKAHLK